MTFDYLLTVQRSTRLVDQNPDDLQASLTGSMWFFKIEPTTIDINLTFNFCFGVTVQGESAPPSLRTVLRETTQSVIPTAAGATCRSLPGLRVMLVVANVYADRLLKLHAASHFRIKQQVKEAVLMAADACAVRAALCAESGTDEALVAEWEAIEGALRDGKPILTDELRLPQGSPI